MDKKLSAIKGVNFALILLLSLHLPIESLLYYGFRITVFSEMYYVLLLSVTLAVQCRLQAKRESRRNIRTCHNLGTLLFCVMFAVTIFSMMQFDEEGVFTFEFILGRVAVAYFVPLLVLGFEIQLYFRFSGSSHPSERVFCIINSIVWIAYLIHSAVHYFDIRHVVAFADLLVIYLPAFLLLNAAFWLMKQFGDTAKSLRSDP